MPAVVIYADDDYNIHLVDPRLDLFQTRPRARLEDDLHLMRAKALANRSSTPRFFIAPACIDEASGLARCDEAALSHQVRNVLRLKQGDKVQLLDGAGHLWQAELAGLGRTFIEFCLQSKVRNETVRKPPFRLISCLPLIKAQRFEWALEKLCELGAAKILPFQSERCVVKLKTDESGRGKRWQSICREASEQCERLFLPELLEPLSLEDLLRQHGQGDDSDDSSNSDGSSNSDDSSNSSNSGDSVDSVDSVDSGNADTGKARGAIKLLLSERNSEAPDMVSALYNRLPCASSATAPLDVIVLSGPEGGFSQEELQMIGSHGFINVTLGALILRSETACTLAAGVVSVINATKTKEN